VQKQGEKTFSNQQSRESLCEISNDNGFRVVNFITSENLIVDFQECNVPIS
jgi:hypothetical protein